VSKGHEGKYFAWLLLICCILLKDGRKKEGEDKQKRLLASQGN
jgi:hypothetical protein